MNDIKQAIYDHMIEEHKSSGKLHPSSLGGCIRQAMYKNKDFEETHPKPDWLVWQMNRYGWYEQPIVKALGGHEQFPLETSRWKGRPDLITVIGEVVEVKSFGSSTRVMDLPRHYHKLQVWCYLTMIQDWEGLDDIETGILVYINRWNDLNRKRPRIYVYDVTPTELELSEVLGFMTQLEEWQDREELPPRPYNNPQEHKWDCMKHTYIHAYKHKEWEIQCPFFAHCWPDHIDKYNQPIVEIMPF